MNLYSIGLDAIILIVVLICAFYHARKGFFASLLGFFGTLLSLVGSILVANWASPLLFSNFFKAGLVVRVTGLLNETGIQTVGDVLTNLFGFLPQAVIDGIGGSLGDSVAANTPEVARMIVEKAVMPVVIPIITMVVFLVLFLALRLLLGVLTKLLMGVNKIPLIGTGNRMLGFAAGVCIGALYAFLILCLIWGIDAAYGGGILASEYFNGSLVYRLTSGLNIFAP